METIDEKALLIKSIENCNSINDLKNELSLYDSDCELVYIIDIVFDEMAEIKYCNYSNIEDEKYVELNDGSFFKEVTFGYSNVTYKRMNFDDFKTNIIKYIENNYEQEED